MALLEPKLAILDETDGPGHRRAADRRRRRQRLRAPAGDPRITHYQRLLDYIVPDLVHVLPMARIVETGDKNLAAELERRGYGTFADHIDGDGPDPLPNTRRLRRAAVGA